jgi:hypothetical protein
MIALTSNGFERSTPQGCGAVLRAGDGREVGAAPNAADRAVNASKDKPLSAKQKQVLSMLARRAYTRLKGRGAEGGMREDVWRHEQAKLATASPGTEGRRISEARNSDFKRIESHFLNLLGQAGAAMASEMQHGTNDVQMAMTKLQEQCALKGLQMSYPAAICRNQYKCALSDATAKQLWQLVFTVRNRKTKGGTEATGSQAHSKKPGRDYVLHKPGNKPQAPSPTDDDADPY